MKPSNIGLNIKYYRKVLGMTQKDLAEKIGVSWEMVSRYETGKSSPFDRIESIAAALEISVSRLLALNTVEQQEISYRNSTVPLVHQPFTNIRQALKTTKQYYVVPDWINSNYVQAFAIEPDLLSIQTPHVENNGILFATTEPPKEPHALVIIQRGNTFILCSNRSRISKDTVVGTVLAWEKRFV